MEQKQKRDKLFKEIVNELSINVAKIKNKLTEKKIKVIINQLNNDNEFKKLLKEVKDNLQNKEHKQQKDELIDLFLYIVNDDSKQSGGVEQERYTDYSGTSGSTHRRNMRDVIRRFGLNNNDQLNEAVGISGVVLIVIFMILQLIFGNNQNDNENDSESTANTIINLLNSSETQGGRKRVKKNRKSKKQSKSKRKGTRRRSVRYRRRR